jgi:hypothetical protein
MSGETAACDPSWNCPGLRFFSQGSPWGRVRISSEKLFGRCRSALGSFVLENDNGQPRPVEGSSHD